MLHLIAAVALACPPGHHGFVHEVTPGGPCLAAEADPEASHTFSVTSTCGPGRLHGPTGETTCDGCAVDVVVDAATVVTLDVAGLEDQGLVDLEYTFTPDAGGGETLAVAVIGPGSGACPDTSGGCDHAVGTPGFVALLALGLLRRRA